MMRKYDVVALGELLVDFTENGRSEQDNPLLEANPGGAPCNVLAMLQKLGRSSAFVGKVGDDLFGRQLSAVAKRAGINMDALAVDPDVRTTLAFVQTMPDGDRDFSFYRNPGADQMLRPEEVPEELIASCRVFHFGTLSLTHEPARSATQRAVALARQAGAIVSFDPNLREPLWDSLDEARRQIEWGLAQCDLLKIADNELLFMTGQEEFDRGVAMLLERYPNICLCCVTAGAAGSVGYCGGERAEEPGVGLGGTIETTGAGDTFCACVIDFVLQHGLNLSSGQLHQMLRFANAAAYLVTTKKGAIRAMPSPEQVEAILQQIK